MIVLSVSGGHVIFFRPNRLFDLTIGGGFVDFSWLYKKVRK